MPPFELIHGGGYMFAVRVRVALHHLKCPVTRYSLYRREIHTRLYEVCNCGVPGRATAKLLRLRTPGPSSGWDSCQRTAVVEPLRLWVAIIGRKHLTFNQLDKDVDNLDVQLLYSIGIRSGGRTNLHICRSPQRGARFTS